MASLDRQEHDADRPHVTQRNPASRPCEPLSVLQAQLVVASGEVAHADEAARHSALVPNSAVATSRLAPVQPLLIDAEALLEVVPAEEVFARAEAPWPTSVSQPSLCRSEQRKILLQEAARGQAHPRLTSRIDQPRMWTVRI